MRLPRINWTKIVENFAAADPYAYAALLMEDGSVKTGESQMLTAPSAPATTVDREARYEAWCRRAGRAVHAVPATS